MTPNDRTRLDLPELPTNRIYVFLRWVQRAPTEPRRRNDLGGQAVLGL